MNAQRYFRLALGFSMAAAFAFLLLRQVSFEEARQTFRRISPVWLFGAFAAFAVGYACRIQRWCLMLQTSSPNVKWHNCAGPFLASFAVNNLLPFRAGDALRAVAFNRYLQTTAGAVIATLLIERLLDFLVILVLLGIALVALDVGAHPLLGLGSLSLAFASFAVGVVLFVFPNGFERIARWVAGALMRPMPRLAGRLIAEIDAGMATIRPLAGGGAIRKLVLWSLASWLAEGCLFWLVALALPSVVEPLGAWLALPVGTLSTLIPSTPGYIGTFDYFVAQSMIALGNPPNSAATYALLVHAILWLPPTFIGVTYLAILYLRADREKK